MPAKLRTGHDRTNVWERRLRGVVAGRIEPNKGPPGSAVKRVALLSSAYEGGNGCSGTRLRLVNADLLGLVGSLRRVHGGPS